MKLIKVLFEIRTLVKYISGSDERYHLEHQCFNGICFFLAIMFVGSSGINWVIGLHQKMVWGTLILGLVFIYFFYLSRFKKLFPSLIWVVLAAGVIFANFAWFYSGGISGSATIICVNIIAVVNLILSGWRRYLAIALICINLGILYLVEYYQPHSVVPYTARQVWFIDLYFTFSVAVLIISFLIYFTMSHFRSERDKVKDSEEKLKTIVDNIPDAVWLKDDHVRFTMVNKPFSKSCGVPVDEIIGNTVFEVWSGDRADLFQKEDVNIMSTGIPIQRQTTFIDPEDNEKRVEIIKTPIVDEQGTRTGIAGIARDITERYAYEDQLKKYRRIVDTSADQMALINRKYEYEAVNQSYLKVRNLKSTDLAGHTMADLHHPGQFDKKIRPYLEKAFQGRIVNFQAEYDYPESGRRHEEFSFYPYRNQDGDIVNLVVHIRDVTENRQMAQRLVNSEKMEAIGTLAGGIAHDFNNILSGILGYAQLGKLNITNSEKIDRHLDQIIKGSQRASDLIRQILTFSRQYEYEKQSVQTSIIVKEALELIRASIPAYIEIQEQVNSDSFVLADPSQLHQIIMNLCTNAYHSMTENTHGRLAVSVKDIEFAAPQMIGGGKIVSAGRFQYLKISDTGSGMDEQTIEKIFDPYFTTKEIGKGTGLGLALVHSIVEELGGWIQVDSIPEKGSNFHIYLPVIEAEPAPETLKHFDIKTTELNTGSGHIMLVDDETSILISTKGLLEDCGYTVSTFPDGRQAYDQFVNTPDWYDLVITDMTMPGMTGDVLSASMLKIKPDLPIILCTGYSDRISEADAAVMGIRKFIQKPVTGGDLTELIRKVLHGK